MNHGGHLDAIKKIIKMIANQDQQVDCRNHKNYIWFGYCTIVQLKAYI